jgi:hypothetical protein
LSFQGDETNIQLEPDQMSCCKTLQNVAGNELVQGPSGKSASSLSKLRKSGKKKN